MQPRTQYISHILRKRTVRYEKRSQPVNQIKPRKKTETTLSTALNLYIYSIRIRNKRGV